MTCVGKFRTAEDFRDHLPCVFCSVFYPQSCDNGTPKGYHLKDIKKGQYGEISKIQEELDELADAFQQRSKILELVELSDLIGAIEGFLEKYHPGHSIEDLIKMSDITKRAFLSGQRSQK